jgi:hypothetical protein
MTVEEMTRKCEELTRCFGSVQGFAESVPPGTPLHSALIALYLALGDIVHTMEMVPYTDAGE